MVVLQRDAREHWYCDCARQWLWPKGWHSSFQNNHSAWRGPNWERVWQDAQLPQGVLVQVQELSLMCTVRTYVCSTYQLFLVTVAISHKQWYRVCAKGICHSALLLYIPLCWLLQTDRHKLQDIVFCWPFWLLLWQTVYIVWRQFEELCSDSCIECCSTLAYMIITSLADIICIKSPYYNTCFDSLQFLSKWHHKNGGSFKRHSRHWLTLHCNGRDLAQTIMPFLTGWCQGAQCATRQ